MEPDLRGRVVNVEHRLQDHSQRLAILEEWRVRSDLADARKEEQFKAMSDKVTGVDLKVDKISDTLSRIMWLILAGLVTGVVAYAMQGGFKLP